MAKAKKPKRCRASTGLLFGLRCELERLHPGEHEVVTNEVWSERFGRRTLVARTVRHWT